MSLSMFKNEKYQKTLGKASFVLLMLSIVACLITSRWYGIKLTVLNILPALSLLCFILWVLAGQFKARPVYLLGFAIVLWFVATRIIIRDYYISQPFYFFAEMLIIYCLAFPFAQATGDFDRRRFFDIFALFILCITFIASCIGIYCAVSGHYIGTEDSMLFVGLASGSTQLYIFNIIPTFSSVYMLISFLLSVYFLLRYWRPILLIPMFVEFIVFFWALELTGCRTVEICLFVCSAPVTGVIISSAWEKKSKIRVPVIIFAMISSVAMSYGLIQFFASVSNRAIAAADLKTAIEAAAEESETEDSGEQLVEETLDLSEIETRELKDRTFDSTSGRVDIYLSVLNYMREHPRVLAFGASNLTIRMMTPRDAYNRLYTYLHNAYLQVLALLGIPGFLIAMALLILLCIFSCRILLSSKRKASEKILPILLLALVVDSLAESMIIVPFDVMSNTFFNFFFFLVAGYVTEIARQGKLSD